MNPSDVWLRRLTWALAAIATAFFLFFCFTSIHGCAREAASPNADACIDKGNSVIDRSPSCKAALVALGEFLKSDPDCAAVVKKTVNFTCRDFDGGS